MGLPHPRKRVRYTYPQSQAPRIVHPPGRAARLPALSFAAGVRFMAGRTGETGQRRTKPACLQRDVHPGLRPGLSFPARRDSAHARLLRGFPGMNRLFFRDTRTDSSRQPVISDTHKGCLSPISPVCRPAWVRATSPAPAQAGDMRYGVLTTEDAERRRGKNPRNRRCRRRATRRERRLTRIIDEDCPKLLSLPSNRPSDTDLHEIHTDWKAGQGKNAPDPNGMKLSGKYC